MRNNCKVLLKKDDMGDLGRFPVYCVVACLGVSSLFAFASLSLYRHKNSKAERRVRAKGE